jgi:hypothetical protein
VRVPALGHPPPSREAPSVTGSRSITVTRSNASARTRAASSPETLAPSTTACSPTLFISVGALPLCLVRRISLDLRYSLMTFRELFVPK